MPLHSNMVLFKCTSYIHPFVLHFFTFQYGSIQISAAIKVNLVNENFTFQYGSIQMHTSVNIASRMQNFTFQYGSIQMN